MVGELIQTHPFLNHSSCVAPEQGLGIGFLAIDESEHEVGLRVVSNHRLNLYPLVSDSLLDLDEHVYGDLGDSVVAMERSEDHDELASLFDVTAGGNGGRNL